MIFLDSLSWNKRTTSRTQDLVFRVEGDLRFAGTGCGVAVNRCLHDLVMRDGPSGCKPTLIDPVG
jgi:hypothetical protein